jgi:hypothetical protein
MNIKRAVLAGLLIAISCRPEFACAAGAPRLGCPGCPESCFREQRCDDTGCADVDVACTSPCQTDDDCAAPNACVDDEGQRLCSPYCDPARCGADEDCAMGPRSLSAYCLPVACGPNNPCAAPGTFCETFVHDCYPLNGTCTAVADCPTFDDAVTKENALTCSDGFCALAVSAPPSLSAPLAGAIDVRGPASGKVFPTEADVQFTWKDAGAPVLVMVYTAAPQSVEDLGGAIWGAALATGTTVAWSEGHAVAGGVWGAGPGAAPTATTLYLIVEALRDGAIVGLSSTVVFQVGGGGWKQPGDACTAEGTIAGECFNAAIPQACIQGECRVLCASPRDCLVYPQTADLACDLPLSTRDDARPNVRICR